MPYFYLIFNILAIEYTFSVYKHRGPLPVRDKDDDDDDDDDDDSLIDDYLTVLARVHA